MIQRNKESMRGETKNPPASNILLTPEKIVDGIAALKRVAKWPKKGSEIIPSYVDEAATIYLEFTPKKMLDAHRPGPRGKVALPHPLSYKRNVCFIARGLEHDDQQDDAADVIKEMGIEGTIKVIPLDEVQALIANKEIDEMKALAEEFDSYLVDRRASKTITPPLQPVLDEKCHFFTLINSKFGRKQAFSEALATSGFLLNTSKDGYVLKVAHTSHTDAQIAENIQRALNYVTNNRPGMFLGSWKHFKSIHLKTGTTKGVPIYVNFKDGEVEERFHAEADISLSPKAIVEGISALKEVSVWRKQGTKSAPVYSDESTLISLQLIPKSMLSSYKPGPLGCLILPHALSYNRRICFIAPETLEKDEQIAITSTTKELGIHKKITVIPQSFLQSATDNKDAYALAEFAEQFDTYLIDANIPQGFQHAMKTVVGNYGKRLCKVNFALERKKGFEMALAKAVLLINSSKDGYILKVAHTSFTDTQIQENIQDALNYIFKFRARIFPGGLKHFKSIHLKAGDTVSIPIYVDDEPDEIDDGISALKQVAAWPAEGDTVTPLYSDESATIYLEFTPTKMVDAYKPIPRGEVLLPHPLSYKRSVCFIQPPGSNVSAILKDLGIEGDIRMIPRSVVCESITDQDYAGLSQLAKLFDTHLTSFPTMMEFGRDLDFEMDENRKFICVTNTKRDLKLGLKTALARSALFVNSSKNGYELKVAHTSHTDKQIKENIQRALDCIKQTSKYPQELQDLKFIHLKTGDSKRVAIYVNDDYFEPDTTPESETDDRNVKPTSGASVARVVGDAPAHKSSKELKKLKKLKRKSNIDASIEVSQKKRKESSVNFATRCAKSETPASATKRTKRRRVRRQIKGANLMRLVRQKGEKKAE